MKLLFFLCCLIPTAAIAQSATITGKVISGSRADAGAKVYIIKYDDNTKGLYDTINNFLVAKLYRGLYDDSIIAYNDNKKLLDGYEGKKRFRDEYSATKPIVDKEKALTDSYWTNVQGTGAVTKELFESLDRHTNSTVSKAKFYPGNITATVDESGNYTAKMNAGEYFVLIISKDRAGINSAEVNGKIFIARVTLADNATQTIGTTFRGT
jgi:hypothetical protein